MSVEAQEPVGGPELRVDRDTHVRLQQNAAQAAGVLRLPFRRQVWRGTGGNWQGAGTGTSIDFQDHRHYLPGDDPRYINWQAYARTGNYTMKLYREEVSPMVDLVVDVSASMFAHADKARRVRELLYFLVASARADDAMLRGYQLAGGQVKLIDLEALEAGQWVPITDSSGAARQVQAGAEIPDFGQVPWRSQSLRVVVSDLLFPGAPETVLGSLAHVSSSVLFFCPSCEAESDPGWRGNVELESCETKDLRKLRFSEAEIARYKQRYRQHFELWREACAKRAYLLGRVGSTLNLRDALMREPFEAGLLELWK